MRELETNISFKMTKELTTLLKSNDITDMPISWNIFHKAIEIIAMERGIRDEGMAMQAITTSLGKWIWLNRKEPQMSNLERCLKISWQVLSLLETYEYITVSNWYYGRYISVTSKFQDYINLEGFVKEPHLKFYKGYGTTRSKSATEQDKEVIDILNSVALKVNKDAYERATKANSYLSLDLDGNPMKKEHNPYLYLAEFWDTFYSAHIIDSRGRIYMEQNYLSIQSRNEEKAILDMGKSRPLNASGRQWLKIALCAEVGIEKLDNLSFEDRISRLDELVSNRVDLNLSALGEKYYAQVYEGADASSTIVYQDMVNSGPAIMGALTKCATTCKNTSYIGTTRENLYLSVYELMKKDNPDLSLTYKEIKGCVIQSSYNGVKGPKKILGKDYHSFIKALKQQAPGASLYLKQMNKIFSKNFKTSPKIKYVLNGRTYEMLITNNYQRRFQVKLLNGKLINCNHIVKLNMANDKYRGFAVNILHSLDSILLSKTVKLCADNKVELVVNHDAYGMHPNDVNTFRICYNQAQKWFQEQEFLKQIASQYGATPKYIGDLDEKEIGKGEYSVC